MDLREKTIQQATSRIAEVIDDEENCHMEICEAMIALSTGDQSDSQGLYSSTKLVECLQYFDRMQQRARYLSTLINAAIEHDSDDAFLSFAIPHSKSAPIEIDAEWLSALLHEPNNLEVAGHVS